MGNDPQDWINGPVKVLVAEDDLETQHFLVRSLSDAGHVVSAVSDGREALRTAIDTDFDAIILDRLLPSMDGLTVLKTLRIASIETPILMLTALARVEDRVSGLESGADDYLVKPFAFTELSARLAALLRRRTVIASETVLRHGAIQMDLLRREVSREGRSIELQPREFSLLEELMRAEGRLVTRTMLLERVWNFHFEPKTNIVETHISRLRGKLNLGFDHEVIRTVRGAGYMMAVDE